jgi:hypothetical protein
MRLTSTHADFADKVSYREHLSLAQVLTVQALAGAA